MLGNQWNRSSTRQVLIPRDGCISDDDGNRHRPGNTGATNTRPSPLTIPFAGSAPDRRRRYPDRVRPHRLSAWADRCRPWLGLGTHRGGAASADGRRDRERSGRAPAGSADAGVRQRFHAVPEASREAARAAGKAVGRVARAMGPKAAYPPRAPSKLVRDATMPLMRSAAGDRKTRPCRGRGCAG